MVKRVNTSTSYLAVLRTARGAPATVESIQVVLSTARDVKRQIRADIGNWAANLPTKIVDWHLHRRPYQPGDVIFQYTENPDRWFIVNRRDLFDPGDAALILDAYLKEQGEK